MAYEPTQHRRSCLGFVVAATVATVSCIFGYWAFTGLPRDTLGGGLAIGGLVSAFLFAGPATVVLGFPLYFVLRGRGRATAVNCALFGGLIGIVTASIWIMILRGMPVGDAMWLALIFSVCGALGGLTFWRIAADEINRDPDLES